MVPAVTSSFFLSEAQNSLAGYDIDHLFIGGVGVVGKAALPGGTVKKL